MLPPSHRSLKEAEFRLTQVLHPKFHGGNVSPKQAMEYGQQLFEFSDALLSSPALVSFCTDQASTPAMKKQMLEKLLGGKVDAPLLAELATLMDARWRTPEDYVLAVESLGVHCVITSLNHDHRARKVEGELFQLATAMKHEPEASNYLSNHNEPVAARTQLVRKILDGKADPAAVLLAERATINPTAGRFRATLNNVVAKIAASRDLTVAKVFAPVELTDHQLKRLQELLTKKYGREVEINVSVDPAVIGGLRVEVGDRVLDDTYRARLYDAERRFAEGAVVPSGFDGQLSLDGPMNLNVESSGLEFVNAGVR
jgi:F-type H+-transporting ATPase subunit delta